MIKWCNKCRYPTRSNRCIICDSITEDLCVDIRPVFFNEKLLISSITGESITQDIAWKIKGGAYIIDSKKVNISIGDILNNRDKLNLEKLASSLIDFDWKDQGYNAFVRGNNVYLQHITEEAMNYAAKVAKKYNDHVPVVSWSGGKDSTVVSDIVRKALGTQKILHFFADTTIEFSTTYKYLNKVKQKNPYIPFMISRPEKNFMRMCEQFGPPSRVMRWCCSIFKTGPIAQTFNSIIDERILTFYGVRKSESNSRAKYKRTTRSPKIAKQVVASPIIDWLDFDVWLYIISNELLFNEAYFYGFSRVGCLYCPNNSRRSEVLMSLYFPDKNIEWKKFLYSFAKQIGKPDYIEYIDNGNWKARQGGDGLDVEYLKFKSADCFSQENTKNYFLNKPVDKNIVEFFKPFGRVSLNDFNNVNKITVTNKPSDSKFSVLWKDNILQVAILSSKDKYLLFQRIECQIRKYQVCIYCSACDSLCPVGAISTSNNKYTVDKTKCINCLKCIAGYTGGCLLNESLVQSKKKN